MPAKNMIYRKFQRHLSAINKRGPGKALMTGVASGGAGGRQRRRGGGGGAKGEQRGSKGDDGEGEKGARKDARQPDNQKLLFSSWILMIF